MFCLLVEALFLSLSFGRFRPRQWLSSPLSLVSLFSPPAPKSQPVRVWSGKGLSYLPYSFSLRKERYLAPPGEGWERGQESIGEEGFSGVGTQLLMEKARGLELPP